MATVQSLVESGTFAIDHSVFVNTVDKVYVKGHFYSEKPPLLGVLGAAVYWPLRHLGLPLKTSRSIAYSLITFVIVGGSCLLCLACFLAELQRRQVSFNAALTMTGTLAVGTLYFPYSTTFASHGFAASWLFIGFHCVLQAQRAVRRDLWLFLAGLSFSLAAGADYATILFLLAFGAYVLIKSNLRNGFVFYLAPALLILGSTLSINFAISGSLKPMTLRPELFHYPGSYWNSATEQLTGVSHNSWAFALRYGARCLFGPQGFLLYNPLLWIGIYESLRIILRRSALWVEALIILAASATMAAYYFISSSNYGGWCYSIRWLIPVIPLVWFFAFKFLERLSLAREVAFSALLLVSFIIAAVGAYDPWPDTRSGQPTFVVNLRSALKSL